jgi:hypothetical protein
VLIFFFLLFGVGEGGGKVPTEHNVKRSGSEKQLEKSLVQNG